MSRLTRYLGCDADTIKVVIACQKVLRDCYRLPEDVVVQTQPKLSQPKDQAIDGILRVLKTQAVSDTEKSMQDEETSSHAYGEAQYATDRRTFSENRGTNFVLNLKKSSSRGWYERKCRVATGIPCVLGR